MAWYTFMSFIDAYTGKSILSNITAGHLSPTLQTIYQIVLQYIAN